MNARYYDAATGRFVSQDPLGFGGGGANLYAYVDNNSVNLSDPTGQFIQFLALAGLAATFAGVATGYAAQHSESFADTLTDFGGWLSERTGTKNFTLSLGFMNVSWGKTSDGVESFGISGTIGLDGFGFGAGSIVRNAPGRGGVQVTPTANAGASYAGFSAGINAVGSSNSFSGGYAFGDGLVQAGPRFVMGADGSIDPTIGVSVGMPFGDASEGGHTWGVTAGAAYGLGSHRAYVDGGLAYYTGARTQNGVDAAGRPTYAKQATWQADYSRPAVTGTASIGAGGVRWEGAGVQWVPGYDDEMYGNGSWGRPSILTAAGAPRSDTMLFLMALPPAGGVEGDGVSREERLRRSSEVLKSFKQRARDAGMGSLTSDDLSTEANVIRVLEQITPSQPGYSQIVRQQARIISSAWQNLNDRANVELWTGGTIIGPVGGDPLVNGIAQSAGGVGEIAGAGLTLMSGVGLTIAGAMAVHGLDSIVAGARTWWTARTPRRGRLPRRQGPRASSAGTRTPNARRDLRRLRPGARRNGRVALDQPPEDSDGFACRRKATRFLSRLRQFRPFWRQKSYA